MHFFRDCRVSAVLESSCMTYTLRFCARHFLALTKKSLFLEVPLTLPYHLKALWRVSSPPLVGADYMMMCTNRLPPEALWNPSIRWVYSDESIFDN